MTLLKDIYHYLKNEPSLGIIMEKDKSYPNENTSPQHTLLEPDITSSSNNIYNWIESDQVQQDG